MMSRARHATSRARGGLSETENISVLPAQTMHWTLVSMPCRQPPATYGLDVSVADEGPACSKLGCWHQRHVGVVREAVARQEHMVVRQVPRDHVLLCDVGDGGRATQAHHHLQLVLEHMHHSHDALLTVRRQGVEHGPTNANSRGTQ